MPSKDTSKDKALSKMKRKEYMGDQKKEEEGKLKEGKGGKDTRTGKNFMKEENLSAKEPNK